jgi:hypothetical protein
MSDLVESWVKVPGYEDFYEVSNHGRFAKLLPDGRQLRKLNSKTPYLSVSVKSLDGKPQKSLYIHKLVAQVFIGPRPDGLVIRHLDGDRYNNKATNLAYGSVEQNYADTKKHKTHWHENNGRAVLSERCVAAIRYLHINELVRQTELAKAFGVTDSAISAVVKGRNWR